MTYTGSIFCSWVRLYLFFLFEEVLKSNAHISIRVFLLFIVRVTINETDFSNTNQRWILSLSQMLPKTQWHCRRTFARLPRQPQLNHWDISPVGGAKHANSNRLGQKDYTCPMWERDRLSIFVSFKINKGGPDIRPRTHWGISIFELSLFIMRPVEPT